MFSKGYSTSHFPDIMDKIGDNRAFSKDASAKEKPKSIKRLLAEFCDYTTAHGLSRLSASRNICSRLIWSLFCMGAFTMFVMQVYNLFVIYLSRPVSTVVKVEHESVSNYVIYCLSVCKCACNRSEIELFFSSKHGKRRDLMVSAMISGSIGPGSSPARGRPFQGLWHYLVHALLMLSL